MAKIELYKKIFKQCEDDSTSKEGQKLRLPLRDYYNVLHDQMSDYCGQHDKKLSALVASIQERTLNI
jgi:hypothetical protein